MAEIREGVASAREMTCGNLFSALSERGYVAIAYGRDAADVDIYNQFGPAVYPITQDIRVQLIEEKSP